MHGLLVLDKPPDVTSHRALAPVKASLPRGTKVGHAGTLDSFATGVLLVMIGDGTRLFDALGTLPKEYEATVLFGEETDTLDPDGEVVRVSDPGADAPADLAVSLTGLTGEVDQVPPSFSALKVNGRRASDRVRDGETPDLAARRVTIYDAEVLGTDWPRARILIRCSSGTYVRSIARDLGAALGLPARLDALRRTAIGPFRPPPDELSLPDGLISLYDAIQATAVPLVPLERDRIVDFGHGRPIPVDRPDAGLVGVVSDARKTVLGLARVEAGVLRPSRVFADGRPDVG